MNESYWEKTLTDGSKELGSDLLIKKKLASWTFGRQDIVSTTLRFKRQNIHVHCASRNGSLAIWRQLDNFAFRPSTGASERLTREVWCGVNGYSKVKRVRETDGSISFTVGNEGDISVPSDISFLVCSIRIDGKVIYRWS